MFIFIEHTTAHSQLVSLFSFCPTKVEASLERRVCLNMLMGEKSMIERARCFRRIFFATVVHVGFEFELDVRLEPLLSG